MSVSSGYHIRPAAARIAMHSNEHRTGGVGGVSCGRGGEYGLEPLHHPTQRSERSEYSPE